MSDYDDTAVKVYFVIVQCEDGVYVPRVELQGKAMGPVPSLGLPHLRSPI